MCLWELKVVAFTRLSGFGYGKVEEAGEEEDEERTFWKELGDKGNEWYEYVNGGVCVLLLL